MLPAAPALASPRAAHATLELANIQSAFNWLLGKAGKADAFDAQRLFASYQHRKVNHDEILFLATLERVTYCIHKLSRISNLQPRND